MLRRFYRRMSKVEENMAIAIRAKKKEEMVLTFSISPTILPMPPLFVIQPPRHGGDALQSETSLKCHPQCLGPQAS